jgi:hypothetical protein
VNACTVWIAFSVSSARLLVSASRSCEDARQAPHPPPDQTISGTTTTGISNENHTHQLGARQPEHDQRADQAQAWSAG